MSVKPVEFTKLPLVPVFVPVTVMPEFPMYVDVLYAEVSVSVALPDVAMEVFDQLAVTPAGNPLTESVSAPVKPYKAETLTV
jgi:hypothetical protein